MKYKMVGKALYEMKDGKWEKMHETSSPEEALKMMSEMNKAEKSMKSSPKEEKVEAGEESSEGECCPMCGK